MSCPKSEANKFLKILSNTSIISFFYSPCIIRRLAWKWQLLKKLKIKINIYVCLQHTEQVCMKHNKTNFKCCFFSSSITIFKMLLKSFRVIVNEKPLNLKKATSSVLSVLLGNFKILKSDFWNKNILLFRYDEESRGIKLNIQDDILKLKALM